MKQFSTNDEQFGMLSCGVMHNWTGAPRCMCIGGPPIAREAIFATDSARVGMARYLRMIERMVGGGQQERRAEHHAGR